MELEGKTKGDDRDVRSQTWPEVGERKITHSHSSSTIISPELPARPAWALPSAIPYTGAGSQNFSLKLGPMSSLTGFHGDNEAMFACRGANDEG